MKIRKLLLVFFIFSMQVSNAQYQGAEVKAALIYYFMQYVHWQNEDSLEQFNISYFSPDTSLYNELDRITEKYKVRKKPMVLNRIERIEDCYNSQIVYIDPIYNSQISDISNLITGRNILLISDQAEEQLFVMINLIRDKGSQSISYEVSKENLEIEGFKYDDQLLLYGGTTVEIKELYKKTIDRLEQETSRIKEYEQQIDQLKKDKELIENQAAQLDSQIRIYQQEINIKEAEYNQIVNRISDRDRILHTRTSELEKQRIEGVDLNLEILRLRRSIDYAKDSLERLGSDITVKQEEISLQEELLNKQKEYIESQRRIQYIFIAFIFVFIVALISIVIAYRAKRQLNKDLENLVAIRTIELEESREHFRSLLNNAPVAILEQDYSILKKELNTIPSSTAESKQQILRDLNYITKLAANIQTNSINRSAINLLDITNEENFADVVKSGLFGRDAIILIKEILERIWNNEVYFEKELKLVRQNAKDLYLIIRWSVLPGYENNYAKVILSLSDVSKLKDYEAELRLHHDHLEDLVTQRTSEIIKLNEKLSATNNELYRSNKDLTESNIKLKLQQDEINALNEEMQQTNEELVVTNDALSYQKNEVEKALVKLQSAQNQLIQSEKMASLGILTAGMAHEINNPMNFISSGFQALTVLHRKIFKLIDALGSLAENNKQFSKIKDIANETDVDKLKDTSALVLKNINVGIERATEIIDSLRLYSHHSHDNFIAHDITESINSSLVILSNKTKNKVEITKQFGEVANVRCIPGQMSQVFVNILSNAIDAIDGENGSIEIHVKPCKKNKFVRIDIKDNGIGVSAENKQKMFDPFFTTKNVGEGTGLGLYIAYGIIEQHGGKIEVESELGKGTTFSILLPKN